MNISMRHKWVLWSMCGVAAVAAVVVALRALTSEERKVATERPQWAEVKRVISGHRVKLNSDEELIYAGLRAPYAHEPLHEESRMRNAELVEGRDVRLRFDDNERDGKGRLVAYVSVDGMFVNETLVREGLAYVRLTPDVKRYSERLMAAQAEARRDKRGLWREQSSSGGRGGHPADPKYGNFHRAKCGECPKIKPQRLIVFKTRSAAFDAGFAPCSKCLP